MTGQDTELYLLRTMLDNRVSDKLSAVESLSMLLRQYSELYNTITKLAQIDNIPNNTHEMIVRQYKLPCCDAK